MTVLVTGGTGKTGTVLVKLLRADDVPVRVASRNPVIGDPSSIRFDWHDPATHAPALRGVDSVFVVPPVNSVDPMPLVAPFLTEARRLGVARVVLLGSAPVLPNAPSALEMADAVRAQPGWVVLRASGFMQNFLSPHPVGERIRRRGEIRTAAGDGRVGWIDTHDIAAAAFALLRPGAERAGESDYLLTGPKSLSYGDAARIITARTGREVRVVEVGTDEQAAHYRAAGFPEEFAASIAAGENGIREGRDDQVSTAVLDLTGRPPRSFEEFVDVHAAAWSDA